MSSGGRKLSLLDATLFVMGGIIGVGVFFTPSHVAGLAYEPWAFLAVWLAGGAIAMCAAFTFAELGGTFPQTGGWYVYLREAFGPFPAYLFAWIVLFVVSTGASATMVLFCVSQLHVALPDIFPATGTTEHQLVAGAIVLAVTAVALLGVKRAALVQNACMVTKLLALAALILGGLLLVSPDAAPGPGELVGTGATNDHARPPSLLFGLLAALKPVLFSYGGWQMVSYIASQVDQPARRLPVAIVLGVGGVVTVYLLANLSFVLVLGVDGVARNADFASVVATSAYGDTGGRWLALAMAVSALGVLIVTLFATPWLYVAMARDRLFFQRIGALHPRRGVPTLALCLQAALTLVYVFTSGLAELVDAVVFVEWIFHGAVAWALLRLRSRRPELERPYRSPLFPLAPTVYVLAAVLVVLSTFWTSPWQLWTRGLGVVLLGALLYQPWRRLVG